MSEYKVGDKLYFDSEKQGYTVQAASDRFLICNKPFNLQQTVLYCIVDLQKEIRGPENLIFGCGAETREQCLEMLVRLEDPNHPSEVSYQNNVPLNIVRHVWVREA